MKGAAPRTSRQPGGASSIHRQIARLLTNTKRGLTSGEIRARLKLPPEKQSQLDRRRRELKSWYLMKTTREGNTYRFTVLGERKRPLSKPAINRKLRAQIFHEARSQCGMCGRLVSKHRITLHIDHRIPKAWGGSNGAENLWALCSVCNEGKKSFFSSANSSEMRKVMQGQTSHERLAKLLSLHAGRPVLSHLLQIVGNEIDWRKRLRELRYLDWKIEHRRQKTDQTTSVTYTAVTVGRHFSGMTTEIRRIERARKAKRSASD